uniref:Protein-export membrane protein SecG n=1 Tax=Boodleopsis sp. H.0758 TaxID=2320802 RepID=A0A386AZS8_9CHLO|nr:hypothetical protein Ycf47 [Boodleopsis sp. H.0758]AYC64957.1 hypothetical protein Ycf47 [Boodleopsis sp. H.0758]
MFLRIFFSIIIILVLGSQKPEWNPLVAKLRSFDLFEDYKQAKHYVMVFSWILIFIFYTFFICLI